MPTGPILLKAAAGDQKGLLFSAGYHSARLAVLAAPELERDDDLGDAAEQREEPELFATEIRAAFRSLR